MRTKHIDPELPWGSWLAIRTVRGRRVYVDQATGEEWRSLRSAFWHGRLGHRDAGKEPPPEQLELIHAVLAARARRPRIREAEEAADLYQGSTLFRTVHLEWLAGHGLIVGSDVINEARPSPEGRSVLLMLHATRPYETRENRPSGATVRQLERLGVGCEEREVRAARTERIASTWDAAFLRRDFGGLHSVVLDVRTGASGAKPHPEWALALDGKEQRENFYEWLCCRMDRWPAWAALATAEGPDVLTQKLLTTMAATLRPHQPHALPTSRQNWG